MAASTSAPKTSRADRIAHRTPVTKRRLEVVDPVIVATHLVQALQTIVSRNVKPIDTAVTVTTVDGLLMNFEVNQV